MSNPVLQSVSGVCGVNDHVKAITQAGLAILGGCLTLAASLRAESWTNQAGRVIEARFESLDGDQVTLVRTNGARVRMPLSSLRMADQQRVRRQTGRSMAPPFVHSAYRDARSIIDQFERLPAARQTEAARIGAERMACAVFDARLRPRLGELNDPDAQQEIRRLRAALAAPPP
jgi:hypothetical protein